LRASDPLLALKKREIGIQRKGRSDFPVPAAGGFLSAGARGKKERKKAHARKKKEKSNPLSPFKGNPPEKKGKTRNFLDLRGVDRGQKKTKLSQGKKKKKKGGMPFLKKEFQGLKKDQIWLPGKQTKGKSPSRKKGSSFDLFEEKTMGAAKVTVRSHNLLEKKIHLGKGGGGGGNVGIELRLCPLRNDHGKRNLNL